MNLRWKHRIAFVTALAGVALLLIPLTLGGVLVSPHALFIDHEVGSGELFLVNQGDVPEEVSVELRFGYPGTDSTGQVRIVWPDAGPGQPSAAEWLRVFPRRMTVQPGQNQLVRVLARPPADLPDGEYWSRVIVTSRALRPTAGGGDTTIQLGPSIELRTITSLTYRKGAVQTGLRLDDIRVRAEGDTLVTLVGLGREGNAAYLGTVSFEIRDTARQVVGEWATPIAVYTNQDRRFALPIADLPAGRYTVRFRVAAEREDIPMANVLPAPPIQRSVGFELH